MNLTARGGKESKIPSRSKESYKRVHMSRYDNLALYKVDKILESEYSHTLKTY